jgi:acyl-CoA synthetase (AMP-forming)/AMP-acid ligase II
MRGNIVMKGYLKNPRATVEAFAGAGSTAAASRSCTPTSTSS